MTSPFIITTEEELDRIVRRAVDSALEARSREHAAMPPPAETSDWITPAEAAKIVGVSPDYLRKLPVPCHRVGVRRRYRRSEVERWLTTPREQRRKAG